MAENCQTRPLKFTCPGNKTVELLVNMNHTVGDTLKALVDRNFMQNDRTKVMIAVKGDGYLDATNKWGVYFESSDNNQAMLKNYDEITVKFMGKGWPRRGSCCPS